jgi:acyl-coenzyme A thioesterase PaaI-like protein
VALLHHELCFGCGRQNLFGLLGDLERREDGSVAGRCFIKQDHQGPVPGTVHPGLLVTALIEAMSFAAGGELRAVGVEFDGTAPVGAFLELEASAERATASVDGRRVASAMMR